MNKFVVTSYYTFDTPYAQVVHECLFPSIQKLECEMKYSIRGVKNLGSWQKNTSYKAEFLRNEIDIQNKNLVFVDCDAEILGYLQLFEEIPEQFNIAAHFLDKGKWYQKGHLDRELLTGTLFLRNNDETRVMLDEWVARCKKSTEWEQKILQKIVEERNIDMYELPIEYCWLKTLPSGDNPYIQPSGDIMIQHNQVSRKFKKLIS